LSKWFYANPFDIDGDTNVFVSMGLEIDVLALPGTEIT